MLMLVWVRRESDCAVTPDTPKEDLVRLRRLKKFQLLGVDLRHRCTCRCDRLGCLGRHDRDLVENDVSSALLGRRGLDAGPRRSGEILSYGNGDKYWTDCSAGEQRCM
jgi:hypothetical protein